uniref:Uncharacterized protein n=1 Tax=Siphoviridae sp. ctbbV81 TaxID=2827900 RepID=A0A8S5TQN3_9CAUD|nr:MAG TPA: hypothetical protein [Siphoviridae sp. ctbbV81]
MVFRQIRAYLVFSGKCALICGFGALIWRN